MGYGLRAPGVGPASGSGLRAPGRRPSSGGRISAPGLPPEGGSHMFARPGRSRVAEARSRKPEPVARARRPTPLSTRIAVACASSASLRRRRATPRPGWAPSYPTAPTCSISPRRSRPAPQPRSSPGYDLEGPYLPQALALLTDLGADTVGSAARLAPAAVLPLADIRLLAPVPRPGKLICIGLNYRDHAAESNLPVPSSPVTFSKYRDVGDASGGPRVLAVGQPAGGLRGGTRIRHRPPGQARAAPACLRIRARVHEPERRQRAGSAVR